MTFTHKSLVMFSLLAYTSQAFSEIPKLDPNKFTVCFATINSDNEKKLFEKEIAKNPAKFNPGVELTNFGKDDWFKKACESGVKCDQLVISGHFGGDFFGSSKKTLPLTTLEDKGCDKSCSGILGQPYEVFLFGCNTLSTREKDSRTPAQYLQVLLNDGIDRAQAELVVESRYGTVGDDHKSKMQRAFSGENKNLYGFTSIGPSGKNVEKFIADYFSKIKPDERLEKLQATRMMDKVQALNTDLAESLKITAFSQCSGGKNDDPNSVIICKLRDKKLSVDQKLAVVEEALAMPNYLVFIPSMNEFFKRHSTKYMNDEQKKVITNIKNNQQITSQIKALIRNTKSLSLSSEWTGFAHNIGILTEAEKDKENHGRLKVMLKRGIKREEVDMICSTDQIFTNLTLKAQDLRSSVLNDLEIEALACLKPKNPEILNLIIDGMKNPKVAVRIQAVQAVVEFEIKNTVLLKRIEANIPSQFALRNEELSIVTLQLIAGYGFADPKYKGEFKKLFAAKKSYLQVGAVKNYIIAYVPTGAEKTEMERLLKKLYVNANNSDYASYEKGEIIIAAGILNTQDPLLKKYILSNLSDDEVRYASMQAVSSMKATDPETHEALFTLMTEGDVGIRSIASDALSKCQKISPKIIDKIIEAAASQDPKNEETRFQAFSMLTYIKNTNKTPEYHVKILKLIENANQTSAYTLSELLDNGIPLSDENLKKVFSSKSEGIQIVRSNLFSSYKNHPAETQKRIAEFLIHDDKDARENAINYFRFRNESDPGAGKHVLAALDPSKKIEDYYLRRLVEDLKFDDEELNKRKEAILNAK